MASHGPEPQHLRHTCHMRHFFVLLVLVGLSWGVSAQNLWRDAPMHASPVDIRALLPEARDTSPSQRAADGTALLEIASAPIAEESFVATFHFESERLQRVHLRARPPSPERTQALLKALQTSLRARYGLPQSTKSRGIAPPGTVDLVWSFRRLTVQLRMLGGNDVELIYGANIPSRPVGL